MENFICNQYGETFTILNTENIKICMSVPHRIPALLHRPGCNLWEWWGLPPSCALLARFAIGARVSLLWQHSTECEMSASACTRSMPGFGV